MNIRDALASAAIPGLHAEIGAPHAFVGEQLRAGSRQRDAAIFHDIGPRREGSAGASGPASSSSLARRLAHPFDIQRRLSLGSVSRAKFRSIFSIRRTDGYRAFKIGKQFDWIALPPI